MRTFADNPKASQRTKSAKSTKPGRALSRQSRDVRSILHLQRTIANQAVQQLLQSKKEDFEATSASNTSNGFAHDFSRTPLHANVHSNIQPKLEVNAPGDIYEQEADRLSEQVMRMPEPQLQRACPCGGGCPKCQMEQPDHEHECLQTKRVQVSDLGQPTVSSSVHEAIRSPGQSLDPAARAFFEPRFGHDFSRVRVHTDAKAAQSARGLNAKAYTVGRDLVFGGGQYAPETSAGKRLLAHELTHVLQQRGKNQIFEEYRIQRKLNEIEEQLRKKFADPDDLRLKERLAERRRKLNIEFQFLNPSEANVLLDRLIIPKTDDTIPEGFQKLSRYTRAELLQILFGRVEHVEAEILHTKLTKDSRDESDKRLWAHFKNLAPEHTVREKLLGVLASRFSESHKIPTGKKIWIKLGDENLKFRNTDSISPDHDCKGCEDKGVNRLGVDWSSGKNWIEIRGDISGNTPDAQYDFKRSVEVGTWKKVGRSWEKVHYAPSGTDDDSLGNSDEDLVPDHNHIYVIDAPGPSIENPIWPREERATEYVYQASFIEWVNVKVGSGAWTKASDDVEWHSITTLEKVKGRWQRKTDERNEIAPGSIPVIEPL